MSTAEREKAQRIANAMQGLKDSGLERLEWLAEGSAIGAGLVEKDGAGHAESKAG